MTVGTTFRAFFAAPIEAGAARALEAGAARALEAAARERLAGPGAPAGTWRVTPAERLHVTLRFLGDASRDLVPRLADALREAAAGLRPARVEFAGWVLLPGPRDPKVLAVGVSDPAGTLASLAARLEERASALGFPGEPRKFLAHVTVARRGRPRRVPLPASGVGTEPASGPVASQVVDRVVLMESVLGGGDARGPRGPTYSVVAEAAL